MRFMILIKSDADTEAGVLPDEATLDAMGRHNEELVRAGVLLAAERLLPSSKGVRVRFSGTSPEVVAGPFAAPESLVAGFWLIEVDSRQEAVEWVRRVPNPTGTTFEIEIRQVATADDFGDRMSPALREQEEYLRAQVAANR